MLIKHPHEASFSHQIYLYTVHTPYICHDLVVSQELFQKENLSGFDLLTPSWPQTNSTGDKQIDSIGATVT